MKGAILEKQEMFYTYMDVLFESMSNMETDYNWLITDYECNRYIEPITCERRGNFVWVTGEKLSEYLRENKIQFIWGVFSAFEKSVDIEEIMQYDLPKSNKRFFKSGIMKIQNPLSLMEIVAMDSSLVFLISSKEEYINEFMACFPMAKDLEMYLEQLC